MTSRHEIHSDFYFTQGLLTALQRIKDVTISHHFVLFSTVECTIAITHELTYNGYTDIVK
jgi:hypothetical protein